MRENERKSKSAEINIKLLRTEYRKRISDDICDAGL